MLRGRIAINHQVHAGPSGRSNHPWSISGMHPMQRSISASNLGFSVSNQRTVLVCTVRWSAISLDSFSFGTVLSLMYCTMAVS